ncbi:MAG TPA: hypothetical protein VNM38_10045, partial [Solirubrobacterales bacterium]|nr:hypothetical protein [Solirubrobacterales bacterium]
MRLLSLPLILLLVFAGAKLGPGLFDSAPAGARPTDRPVHCDRKLKAGADVAAAIRAARGGTTICLASGFYGAIEGSRLKKKPAVTVRPASGARAEVEGVNLIDPAGLRLVDLHLEEGISISPSAARIAILGNEITGANGIYLFGDY